jgi:hypothetical protein
MGDHTKTMETIIVFIVSNIMDLGVIVKGIL